MSEAPNRAPPPLPPPRKDLEDGKEEEGTYQEEEEEEEIPTAIANGDFVEEQWVAPDRYRWFTFKVEGKESELAEITIQKFLKKGTVDLFVNLPGTSQFPTKESFDWNPKKGKLIGPVGEYWMSALGVPSFIEKDDKWLTEEGANWGCFELQVDWQIMNAEAA